MGLASAGATTKDFVAVVLGSDMPLIPREREGSHNTTFISEAYVHGIMDGELVKGADEAD